MAEIVVTLEEAMQKLDISGYKLAIESKIRPNTIYDIVENKKKMLNIETITTILETLNRLAKETGVNYKFGIEDILKYID